MTLFGVDSVSNLGCDALGFIMACTIKENTNRFSVSSIGFELLLFSAAIVCNYSISSTKNIGSASIVLLQCDDTSVCVVPLEFKYISNTCTAPSINGLIRIASDGEVLVIE